MQVRAKELRGAIIDPTQAVHLAWLLGVTIRTLNETTPEAASSPENEYS